MQYTSTRNSKLILSAAQVLMHGIAPDGGLFVPNSIPKYNFNSLMDKSYEEIALVVLSLYFPQHNKEFLVNAVNKSYGENFGGKAGYLKKVNNGLYSLELWHGPTAAFKDYALQIMPKLFVQSRKLEAVSEDILILVATSGDTGSAALAGFSNLDDINIAVFYPENGTSLVQRLQMTTQQAENVAVFGVKGNFDDTQRGVKKAFTDKSLAKKLAKRNVTLSSANSINWGRLAPQIVYYISSYLQLCKNNAIKYGDKVDYCVPTGNFGDILAGWYAKQMGLPIGRLICASNQNNVLSEFIETGHYNSMREFYKTTSPSMDILISSNLERLLYHACGNDTKLSAWMQELSKKGEYTIDAKTLGIIKNTFDSGWVQEDDVASTIAELYNDKNYLCDPHTAVAFKVARQKKQDAPMVVVSTASPFKFTRDVLIALGQAVPGDEWSSIEELEEYTGQKAPECLTTLKTKQERFTRTIYPVQILEIPLEMS